MIVVQLIGGIAIFLYGMKICAEGLKTGTGDWLNKLLGKMTQSKKRSVFFGVIVTMFTQSSGATSIILVSLVNTSLITLVQSLPVLLGAGIGTTLTVQLIAFRIFDYALIFVSLGVFLIFFTKKPNLKTAGEILLGFGLIFYGMKVMSLALEPLKHNPDLTHVLMYFKNNPWLSLITSTLVTAVVQSSGAIIAILIAFAIKGLFGLTTGEEFLILVMPMIFGANLGTCITAFIGSMGASRNAKRVAIAQFVMKFTGIIIFMFIIPLISKVTVLFSNQNIARQIANAHTIFNISITLMFLPFINQFVWLVRKIFPVQKNEKPFKPKFLDDTLLATPDIALDHAKREIVHEGKILEHQINEIINLFDRNHVDLVEKTIKKDDKIDILQKAVSKYLNKILSGRINEKLRMYGENLFYINSDIESIGDIIVKNIIPLAQKYHRKKLLFSAQGWDELVLLHKKLNKQYNLFLDDFKHFNTKGIQKVIKKDNSIQRKIDSLKRSHLMRLIDGEKETIETSTIHLDLLDYLRNIHNGLIDICTFCLDNRKNKNNKN